MGRDVFRSRINETKRKIIDWLKEEGYSSIEKPDPHAHFNILAKIGSSECIISQDVRHSDKLFVSATVVLPDDQISLLKQMTDERKNALFWELEMGLVKNNELGNFRILPNPPQDIRTVFICSRTLFYDDLTKSRLIATIMVVLRAALMVLLMVEHFIGVSKRDRKSPFSV